MSVNPFRSIGSRAATLATAGMLGMSALGIFPAAAQQVSTNAYPGSPACAHLAKDNTDQGFKRNIECEIQQSKRRTEQSRLQGNEAEAVSGCLRFLTQGVKDGTFAKSEILEKAGGKLSDQNACPVAKLYGYGRKAELSPSGTN
jgi:hypothetical protein